jgi:hypothetical protein
VTALYRGLDRASRRNSPPNGAGGRLAVIARREEEHFSIMDGLGEPGSPLFTAIVEATATSSPTGEQRRGVV